MLKCGGPRLTIPLILAVLATVLATSSEDAGSEVIVAFDDDTPPRLTQRRSRRPVSRTITQQLIQSHRDFRSLDAERTRAIAQWRQLNPELVYRFFNDSECFEYVARRCGHDAGAAYKALRPGAFRADLFR